MSLTNAPAIVTQLSTQLAACASWPGASAANHWYPKVAWASATLPLAVLEEESNTSNPYAAGANGLLGGTLRITIHTATTSDAGTVESLARTLLKELLAQDPGIVFRSGDTGLCSDPTAAEGATDTATIRVAITLTYGLSA